MVCLTQIVFTEMLLGILFKQLFAVPLFLLNISISAVVLVLAIKFPHPPRNLGTNRPRWVVPTFNKGGLPASGAAEGDQGQWGIMGDVLRDFKDETIEIFRIIRKDKILFWVFNLFFISVCWIVFLGYLFPSYTWDALWYHLPIVGYIIQSGAIQENPTPSVINVFINIFPKNIELFFVWNVIFLKSNVVVNLSQLLFTVAGVFTIYSIAVKQGLKKEYALYCPFFFFFAPIVILQSTTNYVDVAVSVLFLIAINFLLYDDPEKFSNSEAGQVHLRERKIPILLAGLTTGILLGSKGSGPLFIVILLSLVIIQEFARRANPFNIISSQHKECPISIKNSFMPYVIYFIAPALLIGGYWYIKNWVLHDNPVYPMEISFFGITLFKGLYREMIDPLPEVIKNVFSLIKPFYIWLERVNYYLYDSRLSGFGPMWFILVLPSIPVAIFYAIKRKKHNFLFVCIILIFTFVIYPRNWNTRYVIFFLGLGGLSFGLTLDYFKERQRAIKIIMLLLVVYSFFSANSPCIMPWKITEFLKLPPEERIVARHAPFNIDLQARQDYGLWIWVNNNISEGDTLAYTFEPMFLSPLWNRSFTSKVVYIKSENFNEWVKSLKDIGVTHILIKQHSVEDKWIKDVKRLLYRLWWSNPPEASSERFKVVYSDENYQVLRFNY